MLKKFLKGNNMGFEDIDVSEDREVAMEMIEKSGQRDVLLLKIGDEIILEFDKERISKKLGL